jgi:hypothetical protein
VYMVRHHSEGMQEIMPQGVRVVLDGFDDHFRNGRLAKIHRTTAAFVQQAVQCGEGLPGTDCGGTEGSIGRQTAVETPGEEDCVAGLPQVRKAAAVKRHARVVGEREGSSQKKEADQGVGCGPGVRPTNGHTIKTGPPLQAAPLQGSDIFDPYQLRCIAILTNRGRLRCVGFNWPNRALVTSVDCMSANHGWLNRLHASKRSCSFRLS